MNPSTTSSSSSSLKKRLLPRGAEKEEEASLAQQPITCEGERPQKRFYRQRAHCNPLAHNDSYEYPIRPSEMNWSSSDSLYPSPTPPTVLDIGCGFGGLTLALAARFPQHVLLGLEIRAKVTEYVRLRILAARNDPSTHSLPASFLPAAGADPAPTYSNCAVLRTNSMKFLPNYLEPHSIRKLFFCFPDPHFKRKNHPRRILSYRLLDEYAYLLLLRQSNDDNAAQHKRGTLYCITDVEELHHWHVAACDAHPLFRARDKDDDKDDPAVYAMQYLTEEGQKVERNHGTKYHAVYERCREEDVPAVHAGNFFR